MSKKIIDFPEPVRGTPEELDEAVLLELRHYERKIAYCNSYEALLQSGLLKYNVPHYERDRDSWLGRIGRIDLIKM